MLLLFSSLLRCFLVVQKKMQTQNVLEQENQQLKKRIAELEAKSIYYSEQGKPLTNSQIARYSRHLILPEIGIQGQEKICKGSVLIVGCGGLGSPCALYLAAAGVGKIGLVDFDIVDTSNLHRQIIHQEKMEGIPKVLSAKIACLRLVFHY